MTAFPGNGLSPCDYGWYINGDILMPVWFEGPAIPDSFFTEDNMDKDLVKTSDDDCEEKLTDSDDPWSDDSDMDLDEVED